MPFGLGFGEVLLIFAVLLLLFGAKRLPEIGGAMGKSIRDFKRGINGLHEDRALEPGDEARTPRAATTKPEAEKAPAGEPGDEELRRLRQE